MFDTMQEIIEYAEQHQTTFAEMMIQQEMDRQETSREDVREQMKTNLEVMRDGVKEGLLEKALKV